MNVWKVRLASRRGMTLTELLSAVLILALVAAGAAVGVNVSLRIYRQNTALSDAQTLSSTLSIALMDELRYARDPHDDAGTARFTSSTFGPNASVAGKEGRVTINGRELIGEGAYAGLTADANVDYYGGVFHVTVKICRTGTGEKIQDVKFSVCPLNG